MSFEIQYCLPCRTPTLWKMKDVVKNLICSLQQNSLWSIALPLNFNPVPRLQSSFCVCPHMLMTSGKPHFTCSILKKMWLQRLPLYLLKVQKEGDTRVQVLKTFAMNNRWTSLIILCFGDMLVLRKHYFGQDCTPHPCRIPHCILWHILWWLHHPTSSYKMTNSSQTFASLLKRLR